MRLVTGGKYLALLSGADSGVRVWTYSSILTEQASLKHSGHRQSITLEGAKMGGKSLHQHLLPAKVSPQLNSVLQVEHFLTRMVFMP